MAYASAEDYWSVYDASATDERLDAFLDMASRRMDAALAQRGASVPDTRSDELSAALRDVCISMVHRVLGDSDAAWDIPDGVSQYSQSQGGFSESFTLATPYTDMAVREDELAWILALLGHARPAFMLGSWEGTCAE